MDRKKYRILLSIIVAVEMLLLFTPLFSNVDAFRNGSPSKSDNPYRMTPAEIDNWYENKYSTHDWVAESALDAILGNPLTSVGWVDGDTQFWTNKRKLCYLIGTEVPDAMPEQKWKTSHGKPTTEIPWVRIELNGVICCGRIVSPYHRFYDNNPGDEKRMRPKEAYTSVELYSKQFIRKVKDYLKDGKCDAAAFYIGALSHMIADAAQFVHTTSKEDLTGNAKAWRRTVHEAYESAVASVTSKFNKREEYFDIHNSFLASSIEPIHAIKLVAFNIRWDYAINYYDYFTYPYPSWIQPGPKNASQLILDYKNECKCVSANPQEYWSSSFKAEAQEHLNIAIEYTASIINFFSQFWSGECEDCSSSSNQTSNAGFYRGLSLMLSVAIVIGISNTLLWPFLQMMLYATAAS